jgi:hypothetical protein
MGALWRRTGRGASLVRSTYGAMVDVVLPQRPDRYLREARLAREGTDVRLHAIAWEGAVERHVSFGVALDPFAIDVAEREHARGPSLAALSTGEGVPAVVGTNDEDAAGTDPRVQVAREGGVSRVILERAGERIVVFEARATAAAPALARGKGGTWIAFHHNLREDTGEADLAKWIAVRFVSDAGEVLEPAAPMLDRDRDREGEEQGFEFPSLVAHDDGALTLFGRGSHAVYRQELGATGWSSRIPLGDGAWGCRGRRVAALGLDGGDVLTARRERAGIILSRIATTARGVPQTIPASVAPTSRPHRDVPRRPVGPDPAAAWGLTTLFGDIHQHSAHSDGCGTADEPYLRARHAYGDDFCALSDHESFLGKRVSPGEWSVLTAAAERHDEPGRFATLLAYEWTGKMFPGPGHKVVYVRDAATPIVSRDDEPTGEGLAARLRGTGAIAVPHHVGWTGADEAAHDPEIQPIWEICSCHGCYLHAGHALGQRGELRDQMIESVLARGRRFGFIACSDGHGLLHHHGVGRKRDPFRTGLTAVLATACTREAILDALRARRCYATSGVPIYLSVDAGGQPMGSELRVARGARVPVRVVAEAAEPIREIAIVGAHGDVARETNDTARAELVTDVGAGWVYARVVTASGEMAWSSPVFVDEID